MVSRKRHVLKTISWRIIGTVDTIVLSGFITGSWKFGLAIGGIDTILKTIGYFSFERFWQRKNK